jgi:hypothetical protein
MSKVRCPICDYTNSDMPEVCGNCGSPIVYVWNHVQVEQEMPLELPKGGVEVLNRKKSILGKETVDGTKRSDYASFSAGETGQRAVVPLSVPTLPTTPPDMRIDQLYPEGQPSSWQQMSLQVQEEKIVLDPIVTDRLPRGLPRTRPHLAGKIVHIHSEMEFPDFPNVFRAIIDLLSEFLWITANQPAHKEGERIQVTIVRVRTWEGQLKDARFMGYMRGADLSLGDHISLWGWRRRGSLLVRTGYNHTSRATITTNVMGMFFPGLLLLVLACVIFIVAFPSVLFFLRAFAR